MMEPAFRLRNASSTPLPEIMALQSDPKIVFTHEFLFDIHVIKLFTLHSFIKDAKNENFVTKSWVSTKSMIMLAMKYHTSS